MSNFLSRYLHWLHLRWPAGEVEKLPRVDEHGQSNVSGLYIVGDLTGIPLLKFSADTGARAVQHIAADEAFQRGKGQEDVLDLAIVGAGVSGMSRGLGGARGPGYRLCCWKRPSRFPRWSISPRESPFTPIPPIWNQPGRSALPPRSRSR